MLIPHTLVALLNTSKRVATIHLVHFLCYQDSINIIIFKCIIWLATTMYTPEGKKIDIQVIKANMTGPAGLTTQNMWHVQ